MSPAHYKDLRDLYIKRMETHGLGFALFHPIAAQDMRPPCCGYFDRNGDWNLICNLLPEPDPPFHPSCADMGFDALEYEPPRSMDINIAWQPKTASGTQEHVIAGSAETPDNQPGGAEAEIKYSSNSKFGAVLMTKKPVILQAYNDERLFRSWLEANRGELYKLHGAELKKYGFWLVTRTYTCRGASINAWSDAAKESVISTKAKAAMLGELGEDLNWADRMSSRDWSHYSSKTEEGLVVFMDGIDMSPFDWKLEGLRQNFPGATTRNEIDRNESRRRSEELARRKSVGAPPAPPRVLLDTEELETQHSEGEGDGNTLTTATVSHRRTPSDDSARRGRRLTWYSNSDHLLPQQQDGDDDREVLNDIGLGNSLTNPLARSLSTGRRSLTPDAPPMARTPSLRRETRHIQRKPS